MPTCDHQGVPVHFVETGRGETVVLIHGTAGSAGQWTTTAQVLRHHAHVVMPDLYGAGASGAWHGRQALRLSDEADLFRAALPPAGPVHVVGHSYGGAVAMRFAIDHPEQVATLTLIEPVAFHFLRQGTRGDRSSLEEIKCLAGEIANASARGDSWKAMERFVDFWNGAGTWSRLDDTQRQHLAAKVHSVAQNFWAVLSEESRLTDLARLAMPTMIVTGGGAPLVTRRIARLMAGVARAALVKSVPDGGHMLPLTHAERLAGMIAGHVFAHPAAQPVAA
jgi:pimeloyl-ACP methyl ester carboxylesterase